MAKDLVSVYYLSAKLDDEFSWRRKELSVLRSSIPKIKNPLQSAMLRAALPLLYAHWEGFVKLSMSYYLEHVSLKYLNNNELNSRFMTLSLQNKMGDMNVNNFEVKVRIVELLFSDYGKRSNIPKKNIINTKSNLNYNVLLDILYILDLEDKHIDNKKELINDLVNTRNHIAHGEQDLIEYDIFIGFYDDIISLMTFLKTKIENSALLASYKAAPLLIPARPSL